MNIDHYTTAAFIATGMHRDHEALDLAKERLGTGVFELVKTAMEYVPYIDQLFTVGFAMVGSVPGVFDYEVTEEFGMWYAERTAQDEMLPRVYDAALYLRTLVVAFFIRDETSQQIIGGANGLEATLAKVIIPNQPEL